MTKIYDTSETLLPPANKVAGRECFHRHVSVHRGEGGSYPPPGPYPRTIPTVWWTRGQYASRFNALSRSVVDHNYLKLHRKFSACVCSACCPAPSQHSLMYVLFCHQAQAIISAHIDHRRQERVEDPARFDKKPTLGEKCPRRAPPPSQTVEHVPPEGASTTDMTQQSQGMSSSDWSAKVQVSDF